MINADSAKISTIRGHIAEVEFLGTPPQVHQVLELKEDPDVKLKVYSSSGPSRYFCLVLSSADKLYRGSLLINSGKAISVPVGDCVLGGVVDVFGRAGCGGG